MAAEEAVVVVVVVVVARKWFESKSLQADRNAVENAATELVSVAAFPALKP